MIDDLLKKSIDGEDLTADELGTLFDVPLFLEESAKIVATSRVKSERACNGHAEAVKLLIESGIDTNSQNDEGNTALMLAAAAGQPETLDQLPTVHRPSNIGAQVRRPQMRKSVVLPRVVQ